VEDVIANGRPGVVLEAARLGPVVVTACHRIAFLRQDRRFELPADFVNDIENWSAAQAR
jgi:hypothetical protein